ncbi:MAG: hypothetical protein ACREEP_02450, partial [Dongiaceae bacterium]
MATVSTAGSSSTSSNASSELQRIEREVKRIQQQLAQKNSGKNVEEFQKDSRDVKIDNNATARDIGQLKQNTTRLNLFSSLSKGDAVDVYRFKVSTKAATTFSILNASQEDEGRLRFQIFNKATGRIIADSNEKAGEAKTNFEGLRDGTFELAQGEYVLRVSRAHDFGTERNKEFSYAIQLSQGLFSRDYDTVERAARSTDDPFGISNVSEATNNLTSSIASSVSFLQS